jgi:Secretion system C-terminal sorting domain
MDYRAVLSIDVSTASMLMTASNRNMKYFGIVFLLASLTLPSSLQAQYHWTITHTDTIGAYSYIFYYVDCSGDACTAVGTKVDDTIPLGHLGNYKVLFFRSDNGGSTWIEQDPGFASFGQEVFQDAIMQIQQIDSLNIVAIGDTGLIDSGLALTGNCVIVRSFDAGNTWSVQLDSVFPSFNIINIFNIHFSDSATGIATFGDIIFTTQDAGNHWVEANFYPPVALSSCHSYGNREFRVAPYINGRLYHTFDDWLTVDSTTPPAIDTASTAIPGYGFYGNDTIEATALSDAKPPLLVLRSTDGGYEWQTVDSLAMSYASSSEFTPLNRSVVFLTGVRASVLPVSTDHGNSWQVDTMIADPRANVQTNLPYFPLSITLNAEGAAVAALNITPGRIGSATGFLAKIEAIPADIGRSDVRAISTLQVFPNPSISEINIVSSEGNISILDPLGRSYEVKRSGNSLDVSALPPGVYFISDGHSRAKLVKE